MTTLDVARPATVRLRARPAGVLAAVGLGAVAVVALWWRDTPAIASTGDWLTNAGRLTGLLAGYAAAVLLALMARVPALERGIGADRLTRWHAMGGRYTVGLVVAHTLLIVWGYAVTAHTGLLHQTEVLLLGYPDVLMATVAAALLIGVAIVSARAVRRRLRYETWFYLHFYTYLAIALAFAHQFATGAEFAGSLPARASWSALYAGVGSLLLWYRFGTPLRRAFRHRLRVADVRWEGRGVLSVYVRGRDLHRLGAEPGQFFRWRFLTRDLWWAANPYSLSAPARPDLLRITVKCIGDHSLALARLRPGTPVIAEGPYGAFTAARRRRAKVLLVAGGIGITPLRALFETLPGDLTLLYRATGSSDVVFARELARVAADRGANLHYLIGPRVALRADPLSPVTLRGLVPDARERDVYVCGPHGMTKAAIAALREAGVPRRRIHHESFEF
jgi:predicted ferric reductase